MSTPQTSRYATDLYFLDSNGNVKSKNWDLNTHNFEWQSFVNGGFIARFKIHDSHFDLLDVFFDQDYFRTVRRLQQPPLVKFRVRWEEGKSTPWRIAIISDMQSTGKAAYDGYFEFIAVDPISYYLNRGDSAGSVYEGQIGGDKGVIMQVLNNYVPDRIGQLPVIKKVSETTEVRNKYWMMRQDPKTFIMSLLDWSSSLTSKRTSWIVANGETQDGLSISIKESWTPALNYPTSIEGPPAPLIFRYKPSGSDILRWEMLHNPFTVVLNSMLTTAGISAISGEYLDITTDIRKQNVWVTDDNTENKVNPSFGADRGYSKPQRPARGFTQVASVPEFNAGDIGIPLHNYIDGRARQSYLEMLNLIMRIKITVRGEPRLYDCEDLGRSYVTLGWLGVENDEKQISFMDGNWLVYGWHHRCFNNWETDLYLARIDYDAKAMPGSGQ
jgi:hypothetical protein